MATGGRAIAAVLATGGVARRITVTTTRGARELGLALATARLERRLVAAAKGAETTASVTPATLATCRATGGKIATTLATRSKVATACAGGGVAAKRAATTAVAVTAKATEAAKTTTAVVVARLRTATASATRAARVRAGCKELLLRLQTRNGVGVDALLAVGLDLANLAAVAELGHRHGPALTTSAAG